MNMKETVINNLKAKYINQIQISKTNINLFLASPQGVAEHIDFSETIEKELEKISHANDMLESINLLG
jgi:hypothetical protein